MAGRGLGNDGLGQGAFRAAGQHGHNWVGPPVTWHIERACSRGDRGLVRQVGLRCVDSARMHTCVAPKASTPRGWTANLSCRPRAEGGLGGAGRGIRHPGQQGCTVSLSVYHHPIHALCRDTGHSGRRGRTGEPVGVSSPYTQRGGTRHSGQRATGNTCILHCDVYWKPPPPFFILFFSFIFCFSH